MNVNAATITKSRGCIHKIEKPLLTGKNISNLTFIFEAGMQVLTLAFAVKAVFAVTGESKKEHAWIIYSFQEFVNGKINRQEVQNAKKFSSLIEITQLSDGLFGLLEPSVLCEWLRVKLW